MRPHLAHLLKARGHGATPTLVRKLEAEMSAGWETLDTTVVLLTDVDPGLRTAYLGAWDEHREAFGYSLLSELPYRAGNALEDFGEDQPPRVDLLIVDEYQDLNAADIRFIAAHRDLGIAVAAIGDDDQSNLWMAPCVSGGHPTVLRGLHGRCRLHPHDQPTMR